MNRRDPPRYAGLRLAALLAAGLLGALALAGCGPGSGGSGLPDSTSGTAPPPSASPAPPPSSEPAPAPSACPGPTGGSAAPYAGAVRAVEAGCLFVGERWFVLDGARVERRSGRAATPSDLVVGILVTVTPRSEDAARALAVLIEDAG